MTPQELAIKAQELQNMFNSGQFSESEFKELVNDLIVQESINNAAMELEENITYRNIIVGVINVASAICELYPSLKYPVSPFSLYV